MMPGYIGHNVAQAQDIRARRSFAQRLQEAKKGEAVESGMTREAFEAFIERWCLAEDHRTRTSGRLKGKSPAQVVDAWAQEHPVRRIHDPNALDYLLAEGATKVIGKKGTGGAGGSGWATFRVQFDLGSRYISEADVAMIHRVVDAWSPVGRSCAELLLRLQLTGGLAPGKAASDTTQIQAGTCTRPIVSRTGNLVRARLRRHEAAGEDLRTFTLLDSTGAVVATVTRDIQLVHVNHTLYLEWSL